MWIFYTQLQRGSRNGQCRLNNEHIFGVTSYNARTIIFVSFYGWFFVFYSIFEMHGKSYF